MSRSAVALELGPARVQAALVRGARVVAAAAEPLDPEAWDAAWADELRPLDATLARLLGAIGGARGNVTLWHYGPDVFADVFSLRARPAEVVAAARLGLMETLHDDPAANPTDVQLVARDRAGEASQRHALVAADRDTSAAVLDRWLARAGLCRRRLVPMAAPHLCELVRFVTQSPDGVPLVALRFGEHRSALVAGTGGRVHLVRQVDLGVDLLVAALGRRIDAAGGPVELSRAEAEAALFASGIPTQELDFAPGLRGADVLPVLQPILQRCLVEVRQSLRFGFAEERRGEVQLVLMGPGGAIPRLADLASAETGLDVAVHERAVGFRPAQPASTGGDLHDAIRCDGCAIDLAPLAARRAGRDRRVAHALTAGAALAVVAGGIDALLLREGLDRTRADLAVLRPWIERASLYAEEREALQQETIAVRDALRRADAIAGAMPDVHATRVELALATPPEIRCREVTIDAESESPTCRLRAHAVAGDAASPSAAIEAFVARLAASPLVADVRLGATQTTRIDDRPALVFSLEMTLPPAMPAAGRTLADAAREVHDG